MTGRQPLRDGDEGSSEFPGRGFKRQHFLVTASGDLESGNGQAVQELQSVQKILPLIRTVVREEIERAIQPLSRYLQNQSVCSGSRTSQLRFDCELPGTIFTNNSILSEDGRAVKIVLYDSGSNIIITSVSLSSPKVDVVVLDGDFSPDDENNLTEKEFESKIVKNRTGKRPLLTGELTVQLKEGVGYIGKVSFTDNSSWTSSGSFRLGVKVNANSTIREGVSGAFKVKDNRGESYQKHYPPSLDDEVWRLEKIAKDGVYHDRLAKSGISTVGDILMLYGTNPSCLRSLLEISNNKNWDAIISHAKTCNLDRQLSTLTSADGIGLSFNCINDVVGAASEGQNYFPSASVPIVDQSVVDYQMQLPSIGAGINVNDPSSSTQNADFPGSYPATAPLLPSIGAGINVNNPSSSVQNTDFPVQRAIATLLPSIGAVINVNDPSSSVQNGDFLVQRATAPLLPSIGAGINIYNPSSSVQNADFHVQQATAPLLPTNGADINANNPSSSMQNADFRVQQATAPLLPSIGAGINIYNPSSSVQNADFHVQQATAPLLPTNGADINANNPSSSMQNADFRVQQETAPRALYNYEEEEYSPLQFHSALENNFGIGYHSGGSLMEVS